MHTIKSQNAESWLTPHTTQRATFTAPRRARSFFTPKTVDGRCRDSTQLAAAVIQCPTAARRPVNCKAGFATPAVTPGAEDGSAESNTVAPDCASGALQSHVQQAQVPRWAPQSPQAEPLTSKETQQVQFALLPGQQCTPQTKETQQAAKRRYETRLQKCHSR